MSHILAVYGKGSVLRGIIVIVREELFPEKKSLK
jgi:hypothetical protein